MTEKQRLQDISIENFQRPNSLKFIIPISLEERASKN